MPDSAVTEVPLPPTPPSLSQAVPLDRLPTGAAAKVIDLEVESADARRLKALGLCAGRTVDVLAAGDPLIVRVVGSRVGLSAHLARHILVSPM